MRIVYDYQIFSWQKYGGISRYICEIANQLSTIDGLDIKILAMAYVNEYLKKLKPGLVVGLPVAKINKTGNIIKAVNTNLSKICLVTNPPDIVHETYYNTTKLASRKTKIVTTVYDMLHEKFPDSFPGYSTPQEKAASVKRADHIICISENTKKDLIEILNVDPQKLSVVHLGVSLNFGENSDTSSKLSQPYILYVGDRGGYKNFRGLLQAYASSSQLINDFNLVCFGSRAFSTEEINLINKLGIPESKVIYISGSDDTLAGLYRYAEIFVYPSHYEGFGIPPLEAMAIGCPVACSNTSSMPEVAGNAAEFFNPYDPESIASAVESVVYSNQRKQDLIKFGKQRANIFTWENCAKKTRDVYASLAS